ncbi:MAG: hypothetical protein IPP08_00955 [Chlorobiota bacterium]|nr:hypothetical protein [Chlorobiota bacterium]QQS66779.1 MAG: hypothetical protein IPP08_00955 [Chlorobiota bacterium]
MANKTSQHILGTSTNLLGFCLIIITSLHLTNQTESNYLDEFASIIALLLTISSGLSFLSVKSENIKWEFKLEQMADFLFFVSLLGIFGIVIILLTNFWNK